MHVVAFRREASRRPAAAQNLIVGVSASRAPAQSRHRPLARHDHLLVGHERPIAKCGAYCLQTPLLRRHRKPRTTISTSRSGVIQRNGSSIVCTEIDSKFRCSPWLPLQLEFHDLAFLQRRLRFKRIIRWTICADNRPARHVDLFRGPSRDPVPACKQARANSRLVRSAVNLSRENHVRSDLDRWRLRLDRTAHRSCESRHNIVPALRFVLRTFHAQWRKKSITRRCPAYQFN